MTDAELDPTSKRLLKAIADWGEMCYEEGTREETGLLTFDVEGNVTRDGDALIPEMREQWQQIRTLVVQVRTNSPVDGSRL